MAFSIAAPRSSSVSPGQGKEYLPTPCRKALIEMKVVMSLPNQPRVYKRLFAVDCESEREIQRVQWYPGHIAKAERRLREQVNNVDVVLEVRDARIPVATLHPQLKEWCKAKPRIVVMNRMDMISLMDKSTWSRHFSAQSLRVYWTNGNSGTGVAQLARAASQVCKDVNEKRKSRGLQPRPVRACVIGFPNVGKSALINRLLKRRACDSAPRPGVTRDLRWVRVGGALELLDAPGVIPMHFDNQHAAQLLAMCNDIGEASYLSSQIAALLLERLRALPSREDCLGKVAARFGLPLRDDMTGEDFVLEFAQIRYKGDEEQAGERILVDFRNGALGSVALELPQL